MNNHPRVSVLLTSYNYAAYIEEAIQSVFMQTYSSIELIVVDDGSVDGSRDIIEALSLDARIDVKAIFQDNAGQASALNAAYTAVSGDIVALLDSDDTWYPNKIEQMVEFIRMCPDAGVYQHQLNTELGIKRGGMVSADVFLLWKQWSDGVFNIADSALETLFSPFVPTSGLVFRKAVLDQVFPLPVELVSCPDAFLTRAAVAYGALCSHPLALGVWRNHDRNAGKEDAYGFEDFWLTTVMPALNGYYHAQNLGLELQYEPGARSSVPAEIILSQYYSSLTQGGPESLRAQAEQQQSTSGSMLGRLLRTFLPEAKVQAIRRKLK